ncbi:MULTISPECIES: antitoxin Xre/MbcA/ParS toxin-binding domain-containing protein [unclassified Thiocapsa]|uniref:type II RES/Xre toxin-antitoxin system antitoxin n=1 Tax=unclassified Thiocapsa TaxID=2641286 RepID=UPI0035AFB158
MTTAKTVAKDDRDTPEDSRRPATGVKGSPVGRPDFKAAVILRDDTATRIRVVLFGREATDGDPVMWVRRGLPVTGVGRLQKKLRVRESDLLSLIGMSTQTFKHRKQEHEHLNAIESDRLYRLAKIEARAVEVFEDEEIAANWLKAPNRALGEKPISLLDTEAGTDMVERVLTRIEYGVYS